MARLKRYELYEGDGEEIRERLIHKKETFEGITLAASRMRTVRSWIWV